jgi:hypothetical protein
MITLSIMAFFTARVLYAKRQTVRVFTSGHPAARILDGGSRSLVRAFDEESSLAAPWWAELFLGWPTIKRSRDWMMLAFFHASKTGVLVNKKECAANLVLLSVMGS